MSEPDVYYTVRQNWNGKLWPRMWPNKRVAWKELCKETGNTRAYIEKNCDWTIVPVRLVEVAPYESAERKTE
jgi:hypothetical protein